MMSYKYILAIFLLIAFSDNISFAQKTNDFLVLFSDLKFHSDFEKFAVSNFVHNRTDTFNLFLAIDENMDDLRANACFESYQIIFRILNDKKIKSGQQRKKIRYIFDIVHENFLTKYNELEYFPQIFIQGSYNCVSASILYSLIFNQLGLPYKILQTENHVYLVANPGKESIIIETTNPDLVRVKYSNEDKQQLIDRLESMKMLTSMDINNKSVDELFYEKNLQAKEAQFSNLAGFEYFNKGLIYYKSNEKIKAYELFQKAYFFFPDTEIRNILYSTLIQIVQNSKFKKISDIDYLVQLSRFNTLDDTKLITAFSEIITYFLQYMDKIAYIDSMHVRLVRQIPDSVLSSEISFNYYLLLSKHFNNSEQMKPFIEKAILIKQNHIEANNLFVEQIEKRLDKISDFQNLLDSIHSFEKKYNYQFIEQTLIDYELIAYLNKAKDFFNNNKISEGEFYLNKFEESSITPIEMSRKKLIRTIESTYRTFALYYFYRNKKQKAQEIVDRGLKYVPDSRYIQTAVY